MAMLNILKCPNCNDCQELSGSNLPIGYVIVCIRCKDTFFVQPEHIFQIRKKIRIGYETILTIGCFAFVAVLLILMCIKEFNKPIPPSKEHLLIGTWRNGKKTLGKGNFKEIKTYNTEGFCNWEQEFTSTSSKDTLINRLLIKWEVKGDRLIETVHLSECSRKDVNLGIGTIYSYKILEIDNYHMVLELISNTDKNVLTYVRENEK